MKKFLYIALFAFVSSLAFTSCTEEEVSPKTESDATNSGGSGDNQILK